MMCLSKRLIFAAGIVMVGALPLAAQDSPHAPLRPVLTQAVDSGWLQGSILSGRICLNCVQTFNVSTNVPGATERLIMRPDGSHSHVEYEFNSYAERFSFEFKGVGHFSLRRERKGTAPTIVPLEFTQSPGKPVQLTLELEGKQKLYQAPSVWYLLLVDEDVCREYFIPVLEQLRGRWQLTDRVAEVEEELLHSINDAQYLDRRHWAKMVKQLADDRFSRREAADRELRSAGAAVIVFLEQLDYNKLEPEQQSRIERILADLSRGLDDDTPQQAAVTLSDSPAVWLELLGRPQEATRRTAFTQLAKMLAAPIRFDPAADPSARQKQIEVIRAQLEKQ